MMEVEAIRHAELHSNRHHQHTNTWLFTHQMSFVSPKYEPLILWKTQAQTAWIFHTQLQWKNPTVTLLRHH